MLSKVLSIDETPISPLTWRPRNTSSPKPTPSGLSQSTPNVKISTEEVQQLRAEIAALNSAAERSVKQAGDAGFRAGELAARQAFDNELRVCGERLSETIAELGSTRDQIIRRAEADTVRLALEIARRVLHRELSVDPSAIEALIKAALEKLRNQEIYRVRIHPDHEQLVRRTLQQSSRSQQIEIVNDPTQARGGAVFEIGRGTLDASVETQLQEIERGLADEMEIRR